MITLVCLVLNEGVCFLAKICPKNFHECPVKSAVFIVNLSLKMWEPFEFRERPSVPLLKVSNGDEQKRLEPRVFP